MSGPVPLKSFIVEPQPLTTAATVSHAVANALRRFPAPVIRTVLLFDLLLTPIPFWAWFMFWRWTGRWLGPAERRRMYTNAARFAMQHLRHHSQGTGIFHVPWNAAAIRASSVKERKGYEPSGSCGTCRNCCTTSWLPPSERLSCPFLLPKGCSIYGSTYWDYFNCGRYPSTPRQTLAYDCPRFERPIEVPDRLPDSVGAGAKPRGRLGRVLARIRS